ncbi:MAG: alpha-2-macroglobulin, partial [Lentisphaerae bacterium]|nr:alpha-2-macroglobulin [Lentisphaerota bacterium]
WFALALACLIVNAVGVVRVCRDKPAASSVKATLIAPPEGRLPPTGALRWRFSAAMVSGADTGRWTIIGPVSFQPDVKGSFCWTSPNELVFRPDQGWPACTPVAATLSADLRSLDLRPIATPAFFSLQTDPLTLNNVSQTTYVNQEGLLQMDFSAPVSMDELRFLLSFTNSTGTGMDYRIDSYGNDCKAIVSLSGASTNAFTLHLKAGLRSVAGPLGLTNDIVRALRFTDGFDLVGLLPDDDHNRPLEPHFISATFTAPPNAPASRSFIRIAPPLPFSVESEGQYGWRHRLRIFAEFKPGRNYTVIFQQGLPGEFGHRLEKDITRTVTFPEARPAVEFTAGGHYLSPRGNMLLPFRAIGINRCRLVLHRVYPNNLVYLALRLAGREYNRDGYPGDSLSRIIAEKDMPLDGDRNAIRELKIPLRELTDGQAGAFYAELTGDNGQEYRSAWQPLVISDTGLTVKRSERDLLVWANSIRTLEPLADATVKVFSHENQELFSGTTDPDGLALFTFAALPTNGTPFVVTAQRGDDITFLLLSDAEVNVKGGAGDRPYLTEGYEAYLFPDREVYRPGETAHLKAIVRGQDLFCPPPFPVELKVFRPDGRLLRTLGGMLGGFGTAEFAVVWPDFTATGPYRLELNIPKNPTPLGSTQVSVEEFVPPQIRVDIKTETARCAAGSEFSFEISAQHLFGPPAAGLLSEAAVEFMAIPFAPAGWEAFAFGDSRKPFQTMHGALGGKIMSSSGKAVFFSQASPYWSPPALLKALMLGTVTETGGRTVTAYAGRLIDRYPFYLGLHRPKGALSIGRPHAFEIVVLAPDGTPDGTLESATLTVEKLTWTSVLNKADNGTYYYTSEPQASLIASNTLGIEEGQAVFTFTPLSEGEYRLSAADPQSGASSCLDFDVSIPGQRYRALETPETVELKLDRDRYVAGEIATLLIKAPFTGKALFTLESSRILHRQVFTLTNNTAELSIPIRSDFAPNVYCGVSVLKPVVGEKLWSPHRAAGIVPLRVDIPEKKLRLTLSTPDTLRPRETLSVDVEVTDAAGQGVAAELVAAAVDEGICSLTQFQSPDPYAWFMAPRLPGASLHDLYARLMPEWEAGVADETSAPGGDGLAGLSRRLNPIKVRRFKPTALWSSTVKTDVYGRAQLAFDVPEFTGQLRLMAVGVNATGFGSAEKQVLVRRPLAVQSSLPRFLAPSDSFVMPVHLFNETGQDGEASVSVTCAGSLACPDGATSIVRRVWMAAGAETNLLFDLKALPTPGQAVCRLEAGLGDEPFSDAIELAVRPTAARITRADSGRLPAGRAESLTLPAGWLENTGHAEIHVSSLPGVTLGGGLRYLLDYPYGCLEQTTSKSFPLLYLADLAEQIQPGTLNSNGVAVLVQAGIERILGMQRYDGGFSLWPGCEPYPWGSIYATHFLVEAGKAGYTVPADSLQKACEYLERLLSQHREPGRSDDDYNRAYAAMVLTLAGKPQPGEIARIQGDPSRINPGIRAQIGAALLAAGLRRDAKDVLDALPVTSLHSYRENGGSLGSNVRDDALLLSACLETDPECPALPALVKRLETARARGRWYNSQENAMALMALGKYCRLMAKDRRPVTGRLVLPDGTARPFHAETHLRIPIPIAATGDLILENTGAGALYYTWTSDGVPADGQVAEADNGIKVRRDFLDLEGNPIPPGAFIQGRLYVSRLTLEAGPTAMENIVIEDLLPAGLEIENTNLKTTQAVPWVQARQTLPTIHTDIRDDRLLVFTGPFSGFKEYFYTVRAVTRGRFALPAISAECMYDPEIQSRHGAGTIMVKVTP